jgi:hypothetical protein
MIWIDGWVFMNEPLLQGAIDMHVHVSPDITPRRVDFVDVAREAHEAGMKGLVYKDQNMLTIDRAHAVNLMFPDFQSFGGLVLNHPVGGLNFDAVDSAIKLGAKIIWMPVVNTRHSIDVSGSLKWKFFKPSGTPREDALTVIDERGELLPEALEIIGAVADAGIVLGTGHISPHESLILIEEARKAGVEKIMVTHPTAETIGASLDEQEEMVRRGAFLEHCFAPCMPAFDRLDPEIIAQSIKLVKAENCIMSSDLGQTFNPTPVEGMIMYIKHMQNFGISDREIETMVKTNPYHLLDM